MYLFESGSKQIMNFGLLQMNQLEWKISSTVASTVGQQHYMLVNLPLNNWNAKENPFQDYIYSYNEACNYNINNNDRVDNKDYNNLLDYFYYCFSQKTLQSVTLKVKQLYIV